MSDFYNPRREEHDIMSAMHTAKHIISRTIVLTTFAGIFLLGLVTAFASALLVMRWLIRYVQRHNFNAFAVYRVVLGAVILAILWSKL